VPQVSGLRLKRLVRRLDIIWLCIVLLGAATCFADAPVKKPYSVIGWMRSNHVADLCAAFEVRNFDPITARLVQGTGIRALDLAILKTVRDEGKTWSSLDGYTYRRYVKSPDLQLMRFHRDPLTDTVPMAATDKNLDFGCHAISVSIR
jgi:hypothetical protein